MTSEVVLSLKDVTMRFSGVSALSNISIEIHEGEVCCLIGENGSGKSTLIKIIGGIYKPTSGVLEVEDLETKSFSPIAALHAGIHIIHQDFALLENMTVYENIAFSAEIAGRPLGIFNKAKAVEIAKAALARLGVEIDLYMSAGELTMVNRQIVAIASALTGEAKLIVMDEPTTALSYREIESLLMVVKELKKSGIAVIFVSHKLDEILSISDRIVILRNGELVLDSRDKKLQRHELIRAMTGRDVVLGSEGKASDKAAPANSGESVRPPFLRAEGLVVSGSFENIGIEVNAGEILGITGQLGSGRESLALALFGLIKLSGGTIMIDGARKALRSPKKAIEAGIGYVPGDRLSEGLFMENSVSENISVRLVHKLLSTVRLVSHAKVRNLTSSWIGKLNIKVSDPNALVSTLSGGNQQRVVLARWLSGTPKLLILNGPTVGVDVGSKAEILRLTRTLAEDGMAIMIISDDIPELLAVSDRIMVMKSGRVSASLNRNEVTEADLNEMLLAS